MGFPFSQRELVYIPEQRAHSDLFPSSFIFSLPPPLQDSSYKMSHIILSLLCCGINLTAQAGKHLSPVHCPMGEYEMLREWIKVSCPEILHQKIKTEQKLSVISLYCLFFSLDLSAPILMILLLVIVTFIECFTVPGTGPKSVIFPKPRTWPVVVTTRTDALSRVLCASVRCCSVQRGSNGHFGQSTCE